MAVVITEVDFLGGMPLDPLGSDRFIDAVEVAALLQVGRIISAFSVGGHHTRGGEEWADLAPKTVAKKRREGKERKLIDTGRLRGSISARPALDARGVKFVMSAATPYAKFHQFGTIHMPERKPLVMTESDIDQFAEDIRRAADAAVNGGAF